MYSPPFLRTPAGFGSSRYEIAVSNPHHVCHGIELAELDGAPVNAMAIPLVDDGRTHQVVVMLGHRHPRGTLETPGSGTRVATLAK